MGLVVDFLILVIVGLSAAVGVVTGFVWQVTGFVGLVLGTSAGLLGVGLAGPGLGQALSLRSPGGEIIAFFFFFGLVSLAARITAGVLKPRIDRWQLDKHNRFWGGAAGAVKGLLFAMVAVSVLSGSVSMNTLFQRSLLTKNLAALGRAVMPESLQDVGREPPPEDQLPTPQGSR